MKARDGEAIVRFGPFEVDFRSGELRKHGIRIKLRDKAADVLQLLLADPGELVSREKLRQQLWPANVFVDFENNLNTAVARLREALGDSAGDPHFIETVPRRGYRFIASATASEPAPSRLMVLPFENLSGDPAQEYFSHGLTEEMITQLACLAPARLRVIARTTSVHYKDTRLSVAEMGRELNLDYVVEGSVRRSGGQVRISAQLIRATDQTHVWAGSYNAEARDVLAVQAEVALEIVKAIRLRVAACPPAAPVEPAVHDAYVLGLHYQSRGLYGKAEECFTQATRVEPKFAPAWAKLAITCALSGYFAHAPASESLPKAAAAAERAVQLDESLADAWLALALVHWFRDWNFTSCRRELERAAELNPSHSASHWGLACYYGSVEEDHERACAEAMRMEELDPLNLYFRPYAGWVLYWARQYERAAAHARQTLQLDPECLEALWVLGWSAAAMRRFDVAIPTLESAVEKGGNLFSLAGLGAARAHAGQRAGVELVLDRLRRTANSVPVPAMCFAWVYLAMGDCERGVEWLQKARQEHDPQILCVRVSPSNDRVRGARRFEDFVNSLGLPVPRARAQPSL